MWQYTEQVPHTGSCSSSPLSQLGLWSIRMVAIIAYISKAKYNHLKLKVLLQWAAKENTWTAPPGMQPLISVVAKRSSIEDLVLLRTKLLKWPSFGPHFTQKASFPPTILVIIMLFKFQPCHWYYCIAEGTRDAAGWDGVITLILIVIHYEHSYALLWQKCLMLLICSF